MAIRTPFASIKRMSPSAIVTAVDRMFASPAFGAATPYAHAEEEQVFFIVGCGRSGNTLLRNLLCRAYDVCIPPEIPGLGNTIRRFARLRRGQWPDIVDGVLQEFKQNADVDRAFPGKLTYNLDSELGIDYNRVSRELADLPVGRRSLAEIMLALYRHYAAKVGCASARLGDKTPWNAFHIERIHRVFPRTRYVHMVRDPRATVASYISNFNGIRNITVEDASSRWNDSNRKIERFSSRNPGTVLQVKYEDLVHDFEAVLQTISSFLSLQPSAGTKAVVHGDEHLPHYSKSFEPVATDSLEKWKSVLSGDDVRVIERSSRKLMRRYDYL